jgi:WD40 repeat protein
VSASRDGEARVWDAQTGAMLRSIPTGESAISVAFTADGEHLIVSTATNSATIFTLDTDELIALGRERLTRGVSTPRAG